MTDEVLDISHWQSNVGFQTVYAAGVIGVILKCTESTNYIDPTYAKRKEEAHNAGLLVGAYHFLRSEKITNQAEYFVKNVGDVRGMLLAADYEDTSVSLEQLKEFLGIVQHLTGHSPVIYSGHVIKDKLGTRKDTELTKYRLWLAHYTSGEPTWPKQVWPEYWLWQYTDKGKITGVAGPVDCNNYNPDYSGGAVSDMINEWAGIPRKPKPPKPEPDEVTTDYTVTVTLKISAPPGTSIKVDNVTAV